MEIATVYVDLPEDLKEKFIEEQKFFDYSLADDKPIGSGAFGCVYKTRSTISRELGACKVIVIQSTSIMTSENLVKSVQKEVIVGSNVKISA